jgi:hypothetical protein
LVDDIGTAIDDGVSSGSWNKLTDAGSNGVSSELSGAFNEAADDCLAGRL